jgi:hypothetical protein
LLNPPLCESCATDWRRTKENKRKREEKKIKEEKKKEKQAWTGAAHLVPGVKTPGRTE